MKNILVYISPNKKLDEECSLLSKIQIDNSISLGQEKNLLLITNFPYEYNGVKAIVVDDSNDYRNRPRSIKTMVVPHLIDEGIVEKGEIYWNHDFDAYQLENIMDDELGMEDVDAGFTDYGWRSRWCLGSAFFKHSARDIFQWIKDYIDETTEEDETALTFLTENNTNNINERIKKLNITYQIGMRRPESNYKKATKPLKVLHFHPSKEGLLDRFMYGKNELGVIFMPERLIKVFKYHGIK